MIKSYSRWHVRFFLLCCPLILLLGIYVVCILGQRPEQGIVDHKCSATPSFEGQIAERTCGNNFD